MSDYDNTNRGAIFDNSRKETDKHPDMTGKLNVDGVERWFSAWWKESQSGQQYLSLSLGKPCDEQRQQQPQQSQRQPQRPQGNRPPPSASNRAPARRTPPSRSSGFDDMPDDIPY